MLTMSVIQNCQLKEESMRNFWRVSKIEWFEWFAERLTQMSPNIVDCQ